MMDPELKKLKTNVIHAGHNVHILKNQVPDESVDLVYLDPPFFSGSNYDIVWGNGTEMNAYEDAGMYWQSQSVDEEILNAEFERMLRVIDPDDTLDEEARSDLKSKLRREKQGRIAQGDITGYIHYMAPILRELHRILKPIGSIYLHCDWHANAHLRILMDEIFGAGNFRNEIIWKRTSAHSDSKRCSNVHDVILFYSKGSGYVWNQQYTPYSDDYIKSSFSKTDSNGRRFKTADLSAESLQGGGYKYEWNGHTRIWRLPESSMRKWDKQDLIYYSRTGLARKKIYLDETLGVSLSDVWIDMPPIHAHSKERLGYPTQKPETLIERIIKSSSNKGDIVLDPFVGGGTTCVVTHRLGRKYIGIDISPRACAMTVKNFERYGVTIDYNELNFDYPKVVATMEIMSELGQMPHAKYEAWVRNALGFKDKRRSDSIGVDGIKYMKKKIAGVLVFDEFLEVKKWKHKVGRRVVSKIAGDMQAHGVRKGVIVARQFSRDARKRVDVLAKEGVHIKLKLIDEVIEENEKLMRDPTLTDFYIEEQAEG